MQFPMFIFFVLNCLMLFGNVKGLEIWHGMFFFFLCFFGGEGGVNILVQGFFDHSRHLKS